MGLVLTQRSGRLRLGVGVSGFATREATGLINGTSVPTAQDASGVVVFDGIPLGALVFARVMRPVELSETSDGLVASNYRFELAPLPGPLAFGGVQPPSGGGVRAAVGRTQARLLATDGRGGITVVQPIPVFAAFGAPQDGALVQLGRANHSLQMPGITGATPNLKTADRNLLRLRWKGTVVAGEVVSGGATLFDPSDMRIPPVGIAADGVRRSFAGQLVGRSLAPGTFSLVVSAIGGLGAITVRDDGHGRLAGFVLDAATNVVAQADGVIDYINAIFLLRFGTPTGGFPTADPAATFTAGYEKDCTYRPLDVELDWDSLEG